MSMSNEYLALRIQQGDTYAIEQLWRQTEGLALWVMKRYKLTTVVEEGDLLQVAYFALLKAAHEFNATRGSFSTLYVFRLRAIFHDSLDLNRKHVEEVNCLDAPIGEEKESAMRDMIEDENAINPEDNAVQAAISNDLLQAVDRLPERQRLIIRARYFKELTPMQCANRLSVSIQRVHQIEHEALRRLRHDEQLICAMYGEPEE